MTTTLPVADGDVVLFGYGSLLSRASLERTLGRHYDGPFLAARLDGWERAWNVAMPNHLRFYAQSAEGEGGGRLEPERIIYLNVRPNPSASVNGVLFVVGPEELARFDAREWVYRRERVNDVLRGVEVSGGDVYVYVGLPEHACDDCPSPRVAAIRRTYVDLVESALEEWGEDFRQGYARSSAPLPTHLVIDDRRDE